MKPYSKLKIRFKGRICHYERKYKRFYEKKSATWIYEFLLKSRNVIGRVTEDSPVREGTRNFSKFIESTRIVYNFRPRHEANVLMKT